MDFQEIRFKFDVEMMDEDRLADIFKKTGHWLNIRLDENLKPYTYNENENIYEFMDASHLSVNQTENIFNSFFDFTFDDIVNVSLYKFLVLKIDDNRLTVLAIIHSSIFDYTSIKKFIELFNDPKDNTYENNILSHYNHADDYLKSADFKSDSFYWKNHFLNAGNYVKYYNIKSDDYKNITIPIDNELISGFLDDYDFCEFEFITAVFALYLTRVDRTKGTILKTAIPKDTGHSPSFDIHALLKIPYIQDCSFIEYLNEIQTVYNDSAEYAKVDIDNYSGDVLSYYEVYDFTKLENVNIFNGKGSAFTLNIYGNHLDLLYNAELFSDVYMKHMADNISHLINNLISSPNQFVNETDILCGIEKDLLSDFCKGNSADVDKNKTLAAAFRENAVKYPDFIAVDDGINRVTYAELEKSINSVAYDLKHNYGVDFGECVGLMVPRNYHFPELTCALNRIGAVFTPIDPIYPLKRIEHMLNISEARYIITAKEYADNFSFDVDVIYIEDLNRDYDVSVECLGDGDDLLAIFFTSGTTGLPKAVMVSNKEANGCAVAFKNIFKSNPGDVVGSFVSFSFIASLRSLASLIFGECCRIFNEVEQKDSLLLVKALKEQEMCDLILPPSIGVPIFENEDIKLKYLILAGAKLNELTNTKSDTRLVNFYGTTELILAIANIYDLSNIAGDSVPIGRPVTNTWVYILDDNGMQMPIGVPGEICISNDFLSPGYYNQPDLTSSVFVDNPYCSCDENRRLYHTGDIGFYNFNGEIEILGREDDQLSVRGFRIESNEILNIMKSFDGMDNVYLDVDNDMLTAYYTASDDLDIGDVKDSLNSELPYYMIPSLFVKLDKIPLNANGKIDKRALKIVNAESDVNVGDETLNVVLDAFRDVLSDDSVLLDDNLVELGGTSLSAMNLQRILKDELGVSLSSREIIDLATPVNIANHIKYNLSAYSPLDVNYTFEDKCPLSESQLNVYLDEKVKDMGTAYNNPFKIQFKKKYSFSDVENAIGKLWGSYPVLSARVMEDEDGVSFNFDAEPSIVCGLSSDMDSFVEVFDLNKSLVRFLFVEDESLLCMDFHHLIFDGTSLNIILDSLLDNLNGNIADFVDDGFLRQISMEENVDSDYMEDAADFFEEMLADFDETYDLLDCVELDDNDSGEYVDTFDVDGVLLDSFLKESGVTYNQFFCGVFAYTLSRFTGSSKVSFNLVEDGRGHVDLSESVGMFVRTLPLLVDCRNQDIDSFISYCGGLVNRVMFYDLYPFRLLARDYDLNSNILFQYSHDLFFNALNNDFYRVDELEHDAVGDLSFFIFNADNDKFGIRILYSDKFSSDFIDRFVESYKLILHEMIKFKELSDLNYISDDDVLLLDKINETEHDLFYSDVLEAFNSNLSKCPDNMLVSYDGRAYSYGEGAFIINEICSMLTDSGVVRQDFVALFVNRSEWYLLASIGILACGAIYVPIETTYPDERIILMLKDSQCGTVIVDNDNKKRIGMIIAENNLDIDVLNVSCIVDDEIDSSTHLNNVDILDDDLACVLYTSGTTGIPKGVLVTRKAVINFAHNFVGRYALSQDDVFALFASIGFDVSMEGIFSSIYAGACLNIIPEDIRLDMGAMNSHFIENGVTYAHLPAQVTKLFINQDNTSLKVLCTGGEKLGEIETALPYRFVDTYGPTETFIDVTSINVSDKVDSSSVGHLFDNTKVYVLDEELRRMPVGTVGELYIAGYQVAKGYLNREEENKQAFSDNPFDETPGYSVLYRTGDMVRLLPDGSIGIVGRRDGQVKIRGNRVELSEVESAIRGMDDIEDVTVQAVKNNGNNELVAYVVSSGDLTDDDLSLRVQDYVGEFKPDYMVPSYVISLDFIPLTVSGKVDGRALPDVDFDVLRAEYVAPTNETERHIVDIFESVFNQKGIGLYDDFVRLGGDSISAIRVSSLLEKKGIHCSARDILNYKKPYLIAQHVDENMETVYYDAVEGSVDLLPIQSYFFDQVNLNNYSQEFVLKFYDDCDLDILQKSFDELCNIHDMLRVRYKIMGTSIKQEILPINSHVCKINEYCIDDDFEGNMRDIFERSVCSLDIGNKLLDVNLVHYGGVDYLLIVIHHLIVDGVSWNILLSDLTDIYYKLLKNEKIDIVRPYPYQMWVDDVKDLVDNISDGEKQHWLSVNALLDDSLIKGPTNVFSFNVDVDFDVDNLLMLSEDEYLALAISRAYKKTYGMDIIFNRESYGRDDGVANLNRTVGWFTSQYPVPVEVNNGRDDVSLMSDVYSLKRALGNIKHLGLNYQSLIYTTQDLEYKHCPVTFNFLSNEFVFENELFESVNTSVSKNYGESDSFGVTFNVSRVDDSYIVNGDYAGDTYIGDRFDEFVDNIGDELSFIGNHDFDNVVCALSESQLGVYLDEKVHDKSTAYSVSGVFECEGKSVDDVRDAICLLVDKYPILKGRVLDTGDLPLLVCDGYPAVEIVDVDDYSQLIAPFDLNECLARFFISDDGDRVVVGYDMHHMISDATSRGIIERDLNLALNGELDDGVDLGFVYASRDSFESQFRKEYDDAQDFFNEMFADIDEVSSLLGDVDACVGRVSLPVRGVREEVMSFVQNMGITVSSFLNAVFAYTYSRFTGGDRVYYTFTEHGRHDFYCQDSVGMFVRTIPVLIDCSNKNVRDYLADASDLILEAMSNSFYPFRLLARDFDLSNDVTFEYNYDLNDVSGIQDDDGVVFSDGADRVSELLCVVNDLDDGFVVSLSHLDKISQDTAERFVKVFKEILLQFLDNDCLGDIDYVSDEDVLILDEINETEHDLIYSDVLEAFNENLSKCPDNALVSYNGRVYSYGEGAFIADVVAGKLAGLGADAGDCVSFLVPRSEWYMFCILGILSCGGVYVPLDDNLPDERIKFMINDTESKVVIVSDETYDRISNLGSDCTILNVSNIVGDDGDTLSSLPTVAGDLACILYTSGTTGVPKGVKITRKSLLNLVENYVDRCGLDSGDVYGLFSSIAFDAASQAIAQSIYAGACLSIIPEDIKFNMNNLNEYFIKENITHTFITTQVGRLFMENIDKTSLKCLSVGGENLGNVKSSNEYNIIDAYGPTETFAFISSINNIDKIDNHSVGFLNYNTKAYILDNEFRKVPIGAVGELYLSGYQIAEGYINRKEETINSFINNPFDEDEYGVLYRTGDMVRLLPDGSLGLVGRRDGQVKIRGNRVELGEVESAVRGMDGIEDVTVQAVKNNGNNELVAYVVASSDLTGDDLSDRVQYYVGECKPDYMVPSFVISLDFIPLTVNGKVDKRALPEVDFDVLRAEYVSPTNETERHIVDIFESVFNQKGIGLYDDFVRLGGDSISAIRVSSLLEKKGIHCSARDILNYKKPYLIAQHVDENIETVYYDAVEGSVDLLPIQSYFFDQVNLNNYFQEFVLKFNVDCDLDVLQRSFDELCNIHDMLRARYKIMGTSIKQEILPINSHVCKINEYDIDGDFEEDMRDIFEKSVCSLDIGNKLLDVNLVHYGDVDYLLIVIHHLIVDGVSWNILLSDLTSIYHKLLKNEGIDLVSPYPYQMWVDDVKDLVDNISDGEKQHWLSVNALLDDSLIRGPKNVFSFNFDIVFDADNLLMLSEDEYLALAISRAYKKTYGMDIIFNRESYGRDDGVANLNRTVGWFTSQYPVPVEVNDGRDDVSLMSDVYSLKRALGSIKHLGLNYQSLIYTTKDLKYRHCPVTFNFLSNEFVFENELFESVNTFVSRNDGEISIGCGDSDSFGVTFNVSRVDDSYIVNGDYAGDTYIGDRFDEFIDNIRDELSFIGNYDFDNVVCALSESQLGVYLDEKVHDKSTAYSVSGVFEHMGNKSIGDVRDAIGLLVDKHPILKGRVLDTGDLPLLVCDGYPAVEIVDVDDYSQLIAPFDLNECLARFFIIDGSDRLVVGYDMHHMISDATSRGIVERDLNLALDGELDGGVDLGFVYASRDSFESQFGKEYDDAHDFFNEMFADIDEVPSLLGDVDACVGRVSLPVRGVREEVMSFVQNMGITVSSFLNAVFAYTYSRFTGDDRVYYTFTEHGRHDFYCQDSVGMFVRTIPVLIDCSNRNVRDYLADASDLILDAMSNSFYPFRLLARDFDLSNDVTFEYNYDLNDVSGIRDDDGVVFSDGADRVSELLCVVNDWDDGFVVSLSHLDKISQDTAERFVKVFREVLVQFLDNDCLGDIDYVSDEDMLLLDEINETEHDLCYGDVLEAFNSNLSKCPDNMLVSYNDCVYSYGEGAFIADVVAGKLAGLGVDAGDCVSFLVPRSEWYMFCILGILSMGGVYVPLDDALPNERIKFMISDTESDVVIVSDETYDRAEDLIDEDVVLFNVSDIINGEIGSLSSLPGVAGDLACILYTSGSTGVPKGVKVTRKSIINFSEFYLRKYDLSENDIFALFASIGFDVSMEAIFTTIFAGACLSIIPEDIKLDMRALNEYFVDCGVTYTHLPAQVAKLFIAQNNDVSLKVLCVGGEKLGEIQTKGNGYRFVDSYGPTETFIDVTSIDVDSKVDASSIGHLFDNIKAYILDNEFRRVPVGAVGELYLAGYQIAEGYLNRPEETDKAFLDNPFDEDEYDVLYRTGDLVRLLPDGSIGIVGRRDGQVKIRGNRVELSEVESAIRGMDDIEDVTVQTVKNDTNNELVAYVVASDDLTGDELSYRVQDYVGGIKPDYMVPSFVVSLDEIPLNVNGKVDKRALPEVDFDVLRAEYVAPTNETERHIVDIFESVFNQKGIGLYDDFVRLGGDSISAIRVSSLLEKTGIHCSAQDILNYKKPYLIAQHVNENMETVYYDAVEGSVDLLPIQSYFFNQVNLNNYTQEFLLKFNVDCDLDILQKSFDELCSIHDMLRAHYKISGNSIKQEILPINSHVCKINEYDIDDDFENDMRDIFEKSAQSLDIGNKLLDVNLVHYGDVDYLLIVIHHLIVDGVSWNILLSDLTDIYYKLLKNEKIDIVRPYPYQMWVDDVKGLVDNISDGEKQHWLSVNALLDDSLIRGPKNVFSFNFDIDFDADNLLMLSEDEYLALAISRAYKKTYGMDIIFNRESYGRDDGVANLNRTVGWFTSQYPVPVEVNDGRDDVSLMSDVYSLKRALGSIKHLGLNYQSLIYTTNDLEYRHCPVTFNFLSNEFVFENELFESINTFVSRNDGEISIGCGDSDSFGVTFNVSRVDNSYIVNGDYAGNTYIGDRFDEFVDNIRDELSFIGNYSFDNVVCALSESQLGVYLDEKVHDKSTAYSVSGVFECEGKSVDDVNDAIGLLVDKHPILKGRVLDTGDLPLLVCDGYPAVEIVDVDDYSKLITPFDLNECLARFFIGDDGDRVVVGYDMHHMISDATSRGIVERDLNLALDGELDDGVDLGFVYASRDSFESQFRKEYDDAQDFFNEMFADIDDVPSLLGDVDACVGRVSLPVRGVREEVMSFVQNIGITVSSFLNAVFAYTYSRFTGGDRVYYTFTEHGRHDFYCQDSVGMFVRTIPVLIDCSNKNVRDYLTDASDLILEAMSNSFYPFRLLARDFDLNNDVTFEYNYDLNDVSAIQDDGVVFSDGADRVSELLCVVNDLDDGFIVSLSHLDKISQDTAERFVKVFREILVQFLDNDCLGDIDYVSDEDVLLLDEINETEHDLLYSDVLDAFNENLSKCPDNALVSYNGRVYSYGEGAFIADMVAGKLAGLGVEIGDCVSFLVPRSEWYMFCVLGILSCGGVYVPLDDAHPDDRIQFILEDTESKVVLVSDETYERAKSLTKDAILLNISDILKEGIGTLGKLPVVCGDLACILYTSGTTGLPKGVKITRKSVINVAESYIGTYDLDNTDVCGLFTAIGFDVSNFVITTVMCAGACLSVVPEEIRLNMAELNRYFIKQNVSHAFITTQVGKLFMQSVEETSLDLLYVIGEKLGEVESPKDYILIDAYGPTEAFAYVSSIDNNSKLDASSVGMLNYNTRAYILDDQKRRVLVGAVGELYLSGYQVADGYLNREEKNVITFIENPFSDEEEYNTLYCTGDLVRLLPDGSLGIVGRRDSQVKIRGNRVELSEIEAVIREIDYVDDVTVQTIKRDTNNELVAYVVVSDDLEDSALREIIQDYVGERKPEYMVPSYVIGLDSIPLTVNGKVDKRALPEVNRDSLHVEYAAPRDENEKEIVEAFEKAFNLDKISIYDDFIRLGGDSLIAVKLLNYIESDNVTMADILTFRTPEAIAKNMSEFSFDLDIYSLDDGCPLNSAQINVFADVNIYNKVNAYHIPGYIPISGKYGLEKITDSLDALLDMHPILSTHLSERYEENDNEISNLDLIKDLTKTAGKFGMKKIMNIIGQYGIRDMKGLYKMLKTIIKLFKGEYPYLVKGSKPPISVMSKIDERILIDFFSESFDLYNNLSKFMIVEYEESYYLFYMVHHIIFDATSAGVFKQDFMTLLDGGSIDFDDTFLKSSAFTHQIKNTEKFDEADEFYQPMLSDLDDVGILSEDNPSAEGYGSSSYNMEFDKEVFKSFLRNEGISKNVLFTGVFSYALSHFVNGNKVIFTIIENGRDRFSEKFIGMTSNVMPVVIDCKDQCISSYLRDVADTVYGVLRHSYYPILLLYQKYDFEVNILFQYVPNWIADDFTEGNVEIGGINSEEIYNHILNQFSDFLTEFFVQIYENGDDFTLFISHSNRFSDKMVEDFANMYMTILSSIINADATSFSLSDTLK